MAIVHCETTTGMLESNWRDYNWQTAQQTVILDAMFVFSIHDTIDFSNDYMISLKQTSAFKVPAGFRYVQIASSSSAPASLIKPRPVWSGGTYKKSNHGKCGASPPTHSARFTKLYLNWTRR